MIKFVADNFVRFLILILVQVLLFNHIEPGRFIHVYVYVLFILLLPFETPGWLLLVSAFLLGFSLDLFMDTPGIHASASVFMAFLRPVVLRRFAPRDGYETGTLPRLPYYGLEWFIKYTVLLVAAHHLFLFTVDVFRFSEFHLVLVRTFFSTLLTTVFILLSQFFIYRR
jgi:rod shape-determining protein MreD